MVSTFAVTASGAVVLAAAEELLARRAIVGFDESASGKTVEDLSLVDVGEYIFTGKLDLDTEGDAFEYACTCTRDGCIIDDEPLPAAVE